MTLNVQSCTNCQYSVVVANHKAYNGQTQVLVCRRYPPVFHPGDRARRDMPLHPAVQGNDWCGEWYERGATPPLPAITDHRPVAERIGDIATDLLGNEQPTLNEPPGH